MGNLVDAAVALLATLPRPVLIAWCASSAVVLLSLAVYLAVAIVREVERRHASEAAHWQRQRSA